MDLTATTVLVTGANRGMGRAFAQRLAREPLERLLVGARDPGSVEAFEQVPGGAAEIIPVAVDLGSTEAITASLAAIAEVTGVADGGVDVLVNNAGQLHAGLLERQDAAAIDSMVQVNLLGPIHLTRLLLPGMLERGRGLVVNNASISGYAWFPATSTYAASKAGVVAFSEALRRELDGTGVHVMHLVTPRVETDMAQHMDDQYDGMVDTGSFQSTTPEAWAERVVAGMRSGDSVVGPGGRTAMAKLASRLPGGVLDRVSRGLFTRPTDDA